MPPPPTPIFVGAVLWELAQRFAGVDSPQLSARVIVAHALGLPSDSLIMHYDRELEPDEVARIEALAIRRERGEPVAYLTGTKEFYGLDFAVTPDVLIPRPESEHLIETALETMPDDVAFSFADLGAGSGCLAVTLAKLRPRARGWALELCPRALAVARDNARRHGIGQRVVFVESDFARLPELLGHYATTAPAGDGEDEEVRTTGHLDLVLANPPYVPGDACRTLSPEVRDYEPHGALFPEGPDGLQGVRQVLAAARKALRPGGTLIVEHGHDQGAPAREAAQANGFVRTATRRDLAGRERLLVARAP